MFRIFSRFDSGSFCEWHECTGCVARLDVGVGDYEGARLWLSGFLVDDARGHQLRHSVHAAGDGLGLSGLHGQQLVDQLARMIGTGQVRVCSKVQVYPMEHSIVATAGIAPPTEAPPPVSRSRSAPVAPPPEEPTTLPGNVDAAAMAAVLVAAASDGVPFCEVCEKAKQARKQPAEATA